MPFWQFLNTVILAFATAHAQDSPGPTDLGDFLKKQQNCASARLFPTFSSIDFGVFYPFGVEFCAGC